MIGKHQIVIEAADFVRGMTSGSDISDGGFSSETNAINLTYNPGTLTGVEVAADKSTNLTGNPIGWAATSGIGSSTNGYIIATDGKVSYIDGSQALTTSSALAGTYTTGTTDIVEFFPVGGANKVYVTSTTDIARIDPNLGSGDATWWSVTLGKGALNTGVRHPMLKYMGYVFVGDKNVVHRIESDTAGTASVLSLTVDNNIVALGIEPGTGQILISATQGANYSGTVSTSNRVFVWDGKTTTPSREILIGDMITSFYNVGGTMFVCTPQSLGYWNGSGITFLRKLSNVTLAGSELPYKHHVTNIGNTLYIVDGAQILAYGQVLPGQKVFYYAYDNSTNTAASSTKLGLICPVGDNKLGIGFPTAKFYSFDTVGDGVGDINSFKTRKYKFPRPIFLRSAYIEYAGAGLPNGSGGTLYYKSHSGTNTQLSSLTNSTGSVAYETKDIIGFPPDKTNSLQLLGIFSASPGIRRIIIFYDAAE